MSDLDLGIPFSETAPPRPGRHRRRQRKEHSPGRSFVALLVVLAVFGGLVFGAWWGYGKVREFFTAPDYAGPGNGAVVVTIQPGDTATDIGNTLYKNDVVKSAKAFVQAAEADSSSQNLQPGSYKLKTKMKATDALNLLLDPSIKILKRFTVPEGKSVKQTLDIIHAKAGLPLAALQAAAKDPAALGVPNWARPGPSKPLVLEGFLFPNTYDLQPGDDAKSVLMGMVSQANSVMAEDQFEKRASQLNVTPWELLKVASLVEGEGIPSDFGRIARVVYNRNAANMVLQFDSTTQYWLELSGQQRKPKLTNADLRNPKNTYSTTLYKGLPPTPIANPGKKAIDAAANPESGNWLYFVVVDKDGNSAFTNDYNVHLKNIEKCKQIGRC